MEASASDEEGPNKKEKKPKERLRRKRWFNIHHLKVDKRRPCWEMYCIVWMYYFVSMIPLAVFTFSYLFSQHCTDLFPEKSGILVDFGNVVKKMVFFVLKYSASPENSYLHFWSHAVVPKARHLHLYNLAPNPFDLGRASVICPAWREASMNGLIRWINNFLK